MNFFEIFYYYYINAFIPRKRSVYLLYSSSDNSQNIIFIYQTTKKVHGKISPVVLAIPLCAKTIFFRQSAIDTKMFKKQLTNGQNNGHLE